MESDQYNLEDLSEELRPAVREYLRDNVVLPEKYVALLWCAGLVGAHHFYLDHFFRGLIYLATTMFAVLMLFKGLYGVDPFFISLGVLIFCGLIAFLAIDLANEKKIVNKAQLNREQGIFAKLDACINK